MSKQLDAKALEPSIPTAREQVTTAARFIRAQSREPGWHSHKEMVELIFYMAHTDYEIKVLVHRVLSDPDNRIVWSKYLALALNEALDTLPKAVGAVTKRLNEVGTSGIDREAMTAATRRYRESVKFVKTDDTFQQAMRMVRNKIAAHHRGKGSEGFDPLVAWVATSEDQLQASLGTDKSQFVGYAVAVATAVQDLGEDLQAAYRT